MDGSRVDSEVGVRVLSVFGTGVSSSRRPALVPMEGFIEEFTEAS